MARNKHPEETVARILDTALELFTTKGYEDTSIQDIVDNLDGLTKGAIYYHFKSKEEILDAALDRKMAPVLARLRACRDAAGLTGAERLGRLLSFSAAGPQIELWDELEPAPDPVKNGRLLGMEYRDALEVSSRQYLLPLIEQGNLDGSLACAYPRETADALSLLANLWLVPLFGERGTVEDFKRRLACFRLIAGALGISFGTEHVDAVTDNLADFFASDGGDADEG